MSDASQRPTVAALEALGTQFDSLEAQAPTASPPLRPKWVAAASAALLSLVAVVALIPAVNAVADRVTELVVAIENPAPLRQEHPQVETHLEKPSPELVRTCQERLQRSPTDELCLVVVLTDRGQLAPGDYTNAELHEALDRLLGPSGRLPGMSQ
jgi:hypothetical protein